MGGGELREMIRRREYFQSRHYHRSVQYATFYAVPVCFFSTGSEVFCHGKMDMGYGNLLGA